MPGFPECECINSFRMDFWANIVYQQNQQCITRALGPNYTWISGPMKFYKHTFYCDFRAFMYVMYV